jgi:hypothetical protein
VLDDLDDGSHVVVTAVVRQGARRDGEEALRHALVLAARVGDLGRRDVDSRRAEAVVEQPDQRSRPAAHVEVPRVTLHLLEDTPELQVVPLAMLLRRLRRLKSAQGAADAELALSGAGEPQNLGHAKARHAA